ncbi:hypothetical protein KFE80_07170 [bacterium SCSIO 12696]|nr:hypothetical protein KFE80_07170 [bacterium SCSIO 12696]
MTQLLQRITRRGQGFSFCLFAMIAAFCTYSCMYAFRKPIAVGLYEDIVYWGISIKVLYLSAQVAGYALSKFIGIKVVSEQSGNGRAKGILTLITIAGIALLLFALLPHPWNIVCMFLNGIPLGMVWGYVFSYLEGRKVTEVLAAGLCTSFIASSGLVKTVGSYLMLNWGVDEFWMPVTTAALFMPLLMLAVYMLEQLPPPNTDDIRLRTKREPMDASARRAFFKQFSTGLCLLIGGYVLLTIFRDLRDNFTANIWDELGYTDSPAIFSLTEIPIAVVVLMIIGAMMLIKSNSRALMVNHFLILFGFASCGLSTLAYQAGYLSPISWMIINGFGLYLAYVPFNSVLFERLIATFKQVGNVGFLIYLADSFGYLGSVGVMVYKNLGQGGIQWHSFIIYTSYLVAALGVFFTVGSWCYFANKHRRQKGESAPLAGVAA